MMSLSGKRIFITGGSRGIGLAIALRAAADGASIAIAAKTADPNPKLPGTIFTAAAEIEAAGGKALALQCDIRDELAIEEAIKKTVDAFGGIDIVINNASAINLTKTDQTPAKRFDLMFDVNVRGTFLTSQAALPHLRQSAKDGRNPHILNLSPPLSMKPIWFKNHVAYTMAKYGMSMCVLGMQKSLNVMGLQ
jgi:citronellol/citronellal dehydrogenase